nr:unnamed protein product [Callosobruchus analis]
MDTVICDLFKNQLSTELWHEVYSAPSAETKSVAFIETFLFYFNSCFPIASSKQNIRSQNKKWTTPELSKLKDLVLFYHSNLKTKIYISSAR